MTFTSLMVHLDLSVSNAVLLKVTANLAERFGAQVIGITACQPLMMPYSDGYVSGEVLDEDRAQLAKQCLTAETEFRTALDGKVPTLTWRASIGYDPPAEIIAAEMRSADLLLIAPEADPAPIGAPQRANLGDLVTQVGRPILVVPPTAGPLNLDQVVIGWENTREARRAVWDCLPLLRKAGHVTVARISENADLTVAEQELQDVTAWLHGHGVTADRLAIHSTEPAAVQLEIVAADRGAGVLVTGAYSHNRLREWVLGGVTRDLLQHPARCSFVSH